MNAKPAVENFQMFFVCDKCGRTGTKGGRIQCRENGGGSTVVELPVTDALIGTNATVIRLTPVHIGNCGLRATNL